MYLDYDQLYEVLSAQCLAAADHVMALLQKDNAALYDCSFKCLTDHLKPLVMCDHNVGLEARQNIIAGMVQRTKIDAAAFNAEIEFVNFANTHASSDLLNVLSHIAHDGSLWQHLNYHRTSANHITQKALYGSWMEGAKYIKPLRVAYELDHKIILHCISHEQGVKHPRKRFDDTVGADKRKDLLIQRLNSMGLATSEVKSALNVLVTHPKFMPISNHLFALDYIHYDMNRERVFGNSTLSSLFDLKEFIVEREQKHLDVMHNELNDVVAKFDTYTLEQRILAWSAQVAQRSWTMINDMHAASMNPPHVDEATEDASFAKTIEQRRDNQTDQVLLQASSGSRMG